MSGQGAQRPPNAVYVPVAVEVTPGMLSELHAAADAAGVDVSRALEQSFLLYKRIYGQRALFLDFEDHRDLLDTWRDQAERDGTTVAAMVGRAVSLYRYVRRYGHCPPNAGEAPTVGARQGRADG